MEANARGGTVQGGRRWPAALFEAAAGNRRFVLAGALVVILLAVLRIPWITLDGSLDVMVPDDPGLRRCLFFLREANLSDKVVLSVELTDDSVDRQKFLEAIDGLEKSMGPPLILGRIAAMSAPDLFKDMGFFVRHAPEILDEGDRAVIDSWLTPGGIDRKLRDRYREALKPQGSFMSGAIRHDPLGVSSLIIGRMQRLGTSLGYDVRIEDGYVVSRDGRHVLLVFRTGVEPADGRGSRQLLRYIDERTGKLPSWSRVSVICGHTHTVGNEDAIRSDITLTMTFASIISIALFAVCFRDPRALLIFAVPLVSMATALSVGSLFIERISAFVVGLSSVVAGIAVDYGIHVYVAVRHSRSNATAAGHVARPVCLGAIVTMGVLVAYFFSGIHGYRQLAWFAIASLLCSVGYALIVLPLCLRPGLSLNRKSEKPAGRSAVFSHECVAKDILVVGLAVLCVVTALGLAMHTHVSTDLMQLDGTERSVIESEDRFQETWGRGSSGQGMFVVAGKDMNEATSRNDEVYRHVRGVLGDPFVSFSAVWPSVSRREANRADWVAFWDTGRVDRARQLLADKGTQYGFSGTAFGPFFDDLSAGSPGPSAEPSDSVLFRTLKDRFVVEGREGVKIMSLFPDRPKFLRVLQSVASEVEGSFLVSRAALRETFSRIVASEVSRMAMISLSLVLLTGIVSLRNLRITLIAMVPSMVGVLCLLAVNAGLGRSMNMASMVAAIMVVGLSIDYGVFMSHAFVNRIEAGTRLAVGLSAITTALDAGILVFARHPALLSTGITVSVGVMSSYLAAVIVVPALLRLFVRPGGSGGHALPGSEAAA